MKKRNIKARAAGILLMSLAILSGIMTEGYARKVSGPTENDRRKARHCYLSAARLEVEDKSDAAAELYRKAYEIDSTYVEAGLQYGIRRYSMPQEDFSNPDERAKSRRMARKFIDAYPGDLFPNLFYANIMESSEELEEAIGVLERLNEANPGNTDVMQMLSSLYLDVNEPEKAVDMLDATARIDGEDAEYFLRKAGIKVALSDTVGALDVANKWIEKTPGDPSGIAFLARLQSYFGQQQDALENFKKAESMMEPSTGGNIKLQMANYYNVLGDSVNFDAKTYEALLCEDLDFGMKKDVLAYYLQNLIDENGDRSRGDKLFGVLLTQYPHEPELLALASRYSASKKDYRKALEEIDYALDLDHSSNEYWDQALYYCMMADDYERGAEYFEKAKQYIEEPAVSTFSLAGGMAMMAEKPVEALKIYQEELDAYFPGQTIDGEMNLDALRTYLTADKVDALAILFQEIADAYFKLDDKEKSYKNYENSLRLNPNSALTLNNFAYHIVKDGKGFTDAELEKADEMSKRALNLNPDQPTYLDTRAWVLFCKGEFKEAKEVQLKALELIPEESTAADNAEFYEHLGDIYFMNKEPDSALEYWKKALEGNPEKELLQRKVKHKTFFFE